MAGRPSCEYSKQREIMIDNVIIDASGFAKELYLLIKQINKISDNGIYRIY